eukprot:2288569-Rhodomonas_salina.1
MASGLWSDLRLCVLSAGEQPRDAALRRLRLSPRTPRPATDSQPDVTLPVPHAVHADAGSAPGATREREPAGVLFIRTRTPQDSTRSPARVTLLLLLLLSHRVPIVCLPRPPARCCWLALLLPSPHHVLLLQLLVPDLLFLSARRLEEGAERAACCTAPAPPHVISTRAPSPPCYTPHVISTRAPSPPLVIVHVPPHVTSGRGPSAPHVTNACDQRMCHSREAGAAPPCAASLSARTPQTSPACAIAASAAGGCSAGRCSSGP